MPNRLRTRLVTGAAAAALVVGCSGSNPGATPSGASASRPATGTSGPLPTTLVAGEGMKVQRAAFAAGNVSGIVASKRHPGVFWAIRDRGAVGKPGKPRNGLYAFRMVDGELADLAPGIPFRAIALAGAANHDWEAMGRDDAGNLWIGDIGNNGCDRNDAAVLQVREPDPKVDDSAKVIATYPYRFPDTPAGCGGKNAEAMFVFENEPYIVDKTPESMVYRFPELDPGVTVTLERVGSLASRAGAVSKLSGADLSTDRRLFAVQTHTLLFVYEVRQPSLRGSAFVADLIRYPPRWAFRLGCTDCPTPTNIESISFASGGHDLTLVAENRDVFWVPASTFR
jgi:hypothetical protein